MNPIREEQYPIIRRLLKLADIEIDIATLQVEAMNDGGMGSQRFSSASENSIFGGNVAEASFLDSDGVYVSGALYIDQFGNPYELDMFKSDFSMLESWPKDEEISDVKN